MSETKKPAVKNKGGRPTRCKPELADEIGLSVRGGSSIQAACRVFDIGTDLLSDWGKRDDEPYKGFTNTLKRHFAFAVGQAEAKVYRGGDGWQASARWLESMQRDRWQRSERREIQDDRTVTCPFPDKPGREAAKEDAKAADEALNPQNGSG